jgi:hypothetical protein
MAEVDAPVGGDMKLYYNTGTYGVPVWTEIDEIGDLSLEDAFSMAEIRTRSSNFVRTKPSRRTVALEFPYLYKANSTVFDALRAAYWGKTSIEVAAMDQAVATSGAEGLRAFVHLESFPLNQAVEDFAQVDTIRLTNAQHLESGSLVDPTWMTVA